MKWIVIADDLTGAAEVAGAALERGATAEVHIGELFDSQAEVVVVDADSRSSSPNEASSKVRRITEQAMECGADVLFKKVDSLLRGPVLAELDAMQRAAHLDRCLLVCGNPRKHRHVVAGSLQVDGLPLSQTEFARDPEHPRFSHLAIDLLRDGVRDDAADDRRRGEELEVIDPGQVPHRRLSIGNVRSEADLRLHAARWREEKDSILAAGAAEYFEAILQYACPARQSRALFTAEAAASMPPADSILLISGTRIPNEREWKVVDLGSSRSVAEIVQDVGKVLEKEHRAVLRAIDFAEGSPDARLEKMVGIASEVLATAAPDQVWIEGGRTASRLIRVLGYSRLVATFTAGEGVVGLRPSTGKGPFFLVKPGSYPWARAGQLQAAFLVDSSAREVIR